MFMRIVMVISLTFLTAVTPLAQAAEKHALPNHGTQGVSLVPTNFVMGHDDSAASVIPHWVDQINHHDFEASSELWIPEKRQIQMSPIFQKYLSNIRHVTLMQYKDVTSDWGGIPMDLSRFYAIKVYVAILDYDVVDEKIANAMVGKKMQRCFVVKETASSPWQLFMMQGFATFSAPKSWNLNLEGVTNYGNIYVPSPSHSTEPLDDATYQDFIKQCIGPIVQRAVNAYYRDGRRVPYWQMDILDIKPIHEGSYSFEITVRVQTSKRSYGPPYGLETITLSNQTKAGLGRYRVVKFDHQEVLLS